jgi:Na+-translocating ferredoxin:NAD+ oxidoreductase RnfE subunit
MMETRMYRVADGEYRRWLKVTVRSLGLLIDWNWDASVQRKVRGLAVSGPVVLVTANLLQVVVRAFEYKLHQNWGLFWETQSVNCAVSHW